LPRAKDFLRTYACSFYDLLKDAYSQRIFTWDYEDLIAKEAIQITITCWESFGAGPPGASWIDTLHKAIVQHVGRSLRGHRGAVQDNPPGNIIRTPSPLMIMAQAEAKRKSMEQAPPPVAAEQPQEQEEVAQRAKLLSEYKAATGASNKKIYEARNSGIYKPEFYQWLKGRLPANSTTAKNFETFLKAKKRPIPRKPTM
jgi:hypothetical protein